MRCRMNFYLTDWPSIAATLTLIILVAFCGLFNW